jgi:hypothetical protein
MAKTAQTKQKKQTNPGKKWLLLVTLIILILLFIFLDFLFLRNVFPKQLDDVSPLIQCNPILLNKTDVFFVIPIYNNISIASNQQWCKQILALNKTLGMHGIHHNYKEFNEIRNESYIKRGMEEFKKCFGFYPKIFEAPQLALNKQNILTIAELNITSYGYLNTLTHKVYHCGDTGEFSNSFIDKL